MSRACRTVLVLLGSVISRTGNPASIAQRRIHRNPRLRPAFASHPQESAFRAIALDSPGQRKRHPHAKSYGVSSIKPDDSRCEMDGTEEVVGGLVSQLSRAVTPMWPTRPGKSSLIRTGRLAIRSVTVVIVSALHFIHPISQRRDLGD